MGKRSVTREPLNMINFVEKEGKRVVTKKMTLSDQFCSYEEQKDAVRAAINFIVSYTQDSREDVLN